MKKYRDQYFKRAKRDNYPARSIYKLKELDKRFGLLSTGMKVLDLGAAPGSWTVYASERVGPGGSVLSMDLKRPERDFSDNVTWLKDDVFEPSERFRELLQEMGPFDLVLSDMAPKTTGHRFTDQARSMNLCEEALALAARSLIKGGNFAVKLFQGPDEKAFSDELRRYFETVKSFKPKSSRSESKEIFYLGLGLKGEVTKRHGS
jgi:23S rRNA (uridine2552-2'-O)-methyltransferase